MARRTITGEQLELGISSEQERDRNHSRGGRSFYFFDFDDNVISLSTPAFVFHRDTGHVVQMSSREFAEQSAHIGKRGPYRDYEIRFDDQHGTFKSFRDFNLEWWHRLMGKRQPFIEDLSQALGMPDLHWQGPSWSCFKHAVFNRRPVSIITARGHSPTTMMDGIRLFVREGHLPHEPNYLSIFPVSHPDTKTFLKMPPESSVARLKQIAIRESVKEAFRVYGFNPHHRFGMSDDDPENVRLIMEEMSRLKKEFPENSFFVIETHKGQFIKHEIFSEYTVDQILIPSNTQLQLF